MPNDIGFRKQEAKVCWNPKGWRIFPQIFGLILFLDLIHNDKDC